MFEIKTTRLPGCFELQPKAFEDSRGRFVKVFNAQTFTDFGLETVFVEEYYSTSKKNVIRGMHFQIPPMDHIKLVYCAQGAVLDVVIDLRIGSPTYKQSNILEISAAKANSLYIPKGMAHGFCSLTDQSILVYKVSTTYAPAHDSGILWHSVGVDWPAKQPILSARDQSFSPLTNFVSPFLYV